MATATAPTRSALLDADQRVALRGVGWEGYEAMLRLAGERRAPRIIYLDGDLILMSPSHRHEWLAERFDRIVTLATAFLDIPCKPAATTTFRRRDLDRGIQGDKTYYLANEPRVRDRFEIDPDVDPPPDLAIEVEVAHPATEAMRVYSALGVPEVWRCDGRSLRFLRRQPDGTYVETPTSLALPFLAAAEVLAWVLRPTTEPESRWVRQVHAWVVGTLAPRLGRGPVN